MALDEPPADQRVSESSGYPLNRPRNPHEILLMLRLNCPPIPAYKFYTVPVPIALKS